MRVSRAVILAWVVPLLAAGAAPALAAAGGVVSQAPGQVEPAEQRIDALIRQLGHEDYAVRERAQAELARFSFEAFDAITAASEGDNLEIAARARYLLGLMRVQWGVAGDPPEVRALLNGYELLGPEEKTKRIAALVALPEWKGVPAVCRLIRYEGSLVHSKRAALALLASQRPARPADAKLAELVRENLGNSRRPAAQWLATWLRLGADPDPDATLADWARLVDEELALLARAPAETDAEIVAGLVRFQIPWLRQFGRNDAALAAMVPLVDVATGDLQPLAELLVWLTEQRAWEAVDRLIARFPAQLAGNPLLLYDVPQVQADAGEPQRAAQTAERALALNPGNAAVATEIHYAVANVLWRRGQFAWAEPEFRRAIEGAGAGNQTGLLACSMLSEMLHDEGRELDAAKAIDGVVTGLAGEASVPATTAFELRALRARMNYFYACHFEGLGDRAQQRHYLAEATAADPADVDVLIARHRLPDPTPEYRAETRRLIDAAAEQLRREMAAAPDDPTTHNQFAWLVGNTEGDLEAALRSSKKSLELMPDSAACLDTLAHVHFARGEYEEAVKAQTEAAAKDPHSKQIARKLEVFRKKWEETKESQSPQDGSKP